jgi:hypothetical protein
MGPPPRRTRPRVQGNAMRDAVQPAGDRVALGDGIRLAQQHQEGGLEGVISIGGVAQDAAADVPDHRPVPQQQRLECRLVAVVGEADQQVAVGRLAGSARRTPQVSQDQGQGRMKHPNSLRGSFLVMVVEGGGVLLTSFFERLDSVEGIDSSTRRYGSRSWTPQSARGGECGRKLSTAFR